MRLGRKALYIPAFGACILDYFNLVFVKNQGLILNSYYFVLGCFIYGSKLIKEFIVSNFAKISNSPLTANLSNSRTFLNTHFLFKGTVDLWSYINA